MVDVSRRADWPTDMRRQADFGEGMGPVGSVANEVLQSVQGYIREKPETAALWALGIGFVLGWKLKPW